jgi:hypothetical protein
MTIAPSVGEVESGHAQSHALHFAPAEPGVR